MTPIETVQSMYAAFGRGDVATILAACAEDVEWEHNTFPNPVPWLQPRRGRANVPAFFEALGAIEITRFEPKHFFGEGRLVVSLVDVEFTVKATGKKVIELEEVHIWHFDDAGKLSRFRHRVDTWQTAMALKGD
jgi:ketosteroid isomerase-like protein